MSTINFLKKLFNIKPKSIITKEEAFKLMNLQSKITPSARLELITYLLTHDKDGNEIKGIN